MSGPFHSEKEAPGGRTVGNMALMPLRYVMDLPITLCEISKEPAPAPIREKSASRFNFRQTVKNAGRGFAPDTPDDDIVDEVTESAYFIFDFYLLHFSQTIRLFKPNILFKSFEMKDSVDRVLVYITLYIVGESK